MSSKKIFLSKFLFTIFLNKKISNKIKKKIGIRDAKKKSCIPVASAKITPMLKK